MTVGQTSYGDVIYKVLSAEITPIEAEVTNNETTITYSCGGIDKTVTMPIRDKKYLMQIMISSGLHIFYSTRIRTLIKTLNRKLALIIVKQIIQSS